MILIKPDHARRIEIDGVASPVARPVDIDQAKTGFASLRTLRIYQFVTNTVLEGHAEEDEVFIVVLAGAIELTMTEESGAVLGPVVLSAPADGKACAAYLPPRAAYLLKTDDGADVAYARATPSAAPLTRIFKSLPSPAATGVTVLLEETKYATRLRLKLVQFDASDRGLEWGCAEGQEALIHIRTELPNKAVAIGVGEVLDSWDTVALSPNEHLTLLIAKGCSALALIVTAM